MSVQSYLYKDTLIKDKNMGWIDRTLSYKLFKTMDFVQKIINDKIIKHKPIHDVHSITKPCGYKTVIACEKPPYNDLFNSVSQNKNR